MKQIKGYVTLVISVSCLGEESDTRTIRKVAMAAIDNALKTSGVGEVANTYGNELDVYPYELFEISLPEPKIDS